MAKWRHSWLFLHGGSVVPLSPIWRLCCCLLYSSSANTFSILPGFAFLAIWMQHNERGSLSPFRKFLHFLRRGLTSGLKPPGKPAPREIKPIFLHCISQGAGCLAGRNCSLSNSLLADHSVPTLGQPVSLVIALPQELKPLRRGNLPERS